MEVETKKCTSCNQEKPNTKEFFYSNGKKGDAAGFRSKCKVCEKAKKDAKPKQTREPKKTGTKKCNGPLCNGKMVPVKNFYKDRTNMTDGLQGTCKNCKKASALAKAKIGNSVTEKKCISNSPNTISCGKTKPLSEFSLNHYGTFGRHNQCNECRAKNRRKVSTDPQKTGTKICTGEQCLKINKNGVEKNVSEFHADKYSLKDGLQALCKNCKKHVMAKYRSSLKGFIKLLLEDARSNVRKKAKEIKVKISYDDILELYNKQNKRCSLSGIVMTHEYKADTKSKTYIKYPYNISIDRIDYNGDYVIDNIQLVCNIVNRMKYIFSNEEFINFCDLVSNNKNSQDLPSNFNMSNEIKKYITAKYCDMKYNKDRRAKSINILISKTDIVNLNIQQKGYCALTGHPLTYIIGNKTKEDQHKFSHYNMSIDRKDSNKDYTIDNIQLVCVAINYMKGDLSDEQFISLCKKIVEYNQQFDN